MATVADILDYVNQIAPPELAESWDNVGLLCGRSTRQVKKILVALDPFQGVIAEAIDEQADLIVTHHPIIFREPLTAVNEDTETGQNLLTLIEHGIAAINAHSNLDLASGGVNDCLAAKLSLSDVHPIAAQDPEWSLLRQGTVPEQSLSAFLSSVKAALGCQGLRYVDGGKPVHMVAVGGGACADGLAEAVKAGCDTFVTSDVKYNRFWVAKNLGLNLIDAGHFYTENPVTEYLARCLQEAFPEVTVVISRTHRDIMEFF